MFRFRGRALENASEPRIAWICVESRVRRTLLLAISAELYRDVCKAAKLGRSQHLSIPFLKRGYAALW